MLNTYEITKADIAINFRVKSLPLYNLACVKHWLLYIPETRHVIYAFFHQAFTIIPSDYLSYTDTYVDFKYFLMPNDSSLALLGLT